MDMMKNDIKYNIDINNIYVKKLSPTEEKDILKRSEELVFSNEVVKSAINILSKE